jgi:hypothetical protein
MGWFEAHTLRNESNRGANRFRMHVPFVPPVIDKRVIDSPFVVPIVQELVGQDCICHYFARTPKKPRSPIRLS